MGPRTGPVAGGLTEGKTEDAGARHSGRGNRGVGGAVEAPPIATTTWGSCVTQGSGATRLGPLDDRRSTGALLITQNAGRAGRIAAAMDAHMILTTVVLSASHAFLCLDRTSVDLVLVDLEVNEPSPALIRAVAARTDAPVLAFGPPALADPSLYQAGIRIYVDSRLGAAAIAAQAEVLAAMAAPPRPEGEAPQRRDRPRRGGLRAAPRRRRVVRNREGR